MSQSDADPSIQNGIPYKWDGARNPNIPPYPLNNGVGSSQSSRDSSPIPKFSNVPLSQLPPNRNQIPSSQLPPSSSRSMFSPISTPQGLKSASVITNTPQSSPNIQNFGTSTPIIPKTQVTSAGNTFTGNNLFVNVSLTSSGSVPQSPHNPNETNRISPVQLNGSQSLTNPITTENLRQNLNQPVMSSSQLPQERHPPVKNLLISQQEVSQPMFMPVSAQMHFSEASSTLHTPRVPHPATVQESQKPISVQSHFMNTPQVRPTLQPTMQPSQKVPVSGSLPQGQPQETSQPNLPTSSQNQATNPTMIQQQKAPVSLQAHFTSSPQVQLSQPVQNVPVSGQSQLEGQLQAVLQPSVPISNQNQPNSSGQSSVSSSQSQQKMPVVAPIPFSALKTFLPTSSQEKTDHQSAFATVGSQKQFSQSLGNLPGSQNVGNPTVQYGNPPMNQNMKMNQQSFSSQNIRQPNVTEQSFNQNARLQNPNSQNYTNPLLMGVSNHNTAFLNNQMMNAPRLSQPASVNPPVSQYMGMTNQFSPASNQAVNNQYGKSVTHQQAPVTSNQQLTSQPTSYQSVPQTNSQQFHKGLINQNPSGYLPSSQNQQIAPPMMQQFGAPPVSQSLTKQSGFPPTSQVMGPPPTSQNVTSFSTNQVMTPPPTSQTMKPPTNQTMAPPPSQTMAHPSTSQSMVPPPTNQTMAPPPVNQTMAPSPKSQTMMPPPTGQTMVPPPTNQTVGSLTNNQSMNNQFGQSQSYQSRGNQLGPPPVSQNTGSQQFGPPPTSQNAGLYNQKYNKNIVNQNVQSAVNQNRGVSSGDMNRPPTYNNTMASQDNVPQYPTTPTSAIYSKRYPQQNYQTSTPSSMPSTYSQPYRQATPTQGYQQSYPQNYQQSLSQGMTNMSLGQTGYNRIWSAENFDLLQCPNILPPEKMETPRVCLGQDFLNAANCSTDIFRCTMTKIPETGSLLQKSRLPLGVLIHPFKDLNHLPVIQCSTIVRCRTCRTYINPFVFFVDTKRWKCNLCYRVNELPEEFQYDPVSKSYGDPSRRPEIKASTIEYIAPSEYMLRPPQPAVYLFLLDISRLAIESGYLHTICDVLTAQLSTLPGDSRTQIGFLAYNSTLHFFSLGEGLSQPHEMTVLDIDDVFLPCPDNLLVNLKERMDLVTDLLTLLPTRYINSYDNGSALGAALQAAFKMMSATGGRVTVFQATLPTLGPGALTIREDPNQRAGKEAPHLNPATDFYKRLALECSGHQVAVDLFLMNSQYVDIATLSGISRFSGGCMHHFPLFKASSAVHAESLERCFRRYLTRKIGFEAVMRIRCTRGLSVHTFHGNFFVRSTDLLSLPNVNPDAGFGMQVSIDESLTDLQTVCFQAALLYTSSKGERRIRVHTLCLPVVNTLQDVLNSADQQCIVGILAKMAVDRSLQSSLSDARDAFINVAIDILHSYKVSLNMGESVSGLLASHSLKLLPLYILALLKHVAFRSGQSTRLDDRVFAMCEMKTLPLAQLVQQVYPDLYPIHNLSDEGGFVDPDGIVIPQPPRLQLTSRNVDAFGVYLLDAGQQMIIFVCQNAAPSFLSHVLGVPSYSAISDQFYELPKIENPDNQRLHTFIGSLNDEKPYSASLQIMRENSPHRTLFLERLIEDRIESALSYNEFLQHIKTQVK